MALRDFLKKPANSVAPDRSFFGDQYDIKIDTLFDSLVASFDYIEANYGGTPTGPANGDLTGNYPNPTLKTTGVTATSYPTTGTIPTFTVDTKGRLTVAGFTADGSNINVSAANLTGTVPVGRLPTAIPAVNIATGAVDNTVFNYLTGVTSNIQTQLNSKLDSNSNKLNPAPGTAGGIPYDTVTGYTLLSASTSNKVLHSGPTPSWSAVSLTTDVSGVLPLSNLPGNGQVSVYPNFPLTGGGTMSLGGSVSIECPDFFAPVTLAALSNFGFWAGEQYVGPSYDASSNANLTGYFSSGWHRVQRRGQFQSFKMTNSEVPPFDVPIQIWQANSGDPLGFFFTGITIVMPKNAYIVSLAETLDVREDDLIVCYNPDIALGYYCGPMTIQAELKIS